MQYACIDPVTAREELYQESLAVHGQAMQVLVRQVRLRKAAEQRAATLENQLKVAKLFFFFCLFVFLFLFVYLYC